MEGYSLSDLKSKLQAVRGETRVKAAEDNIRNEFLQAAIDEIMTEHDWEFNRLTEDLEIDSEGFYDVPSNMSILNDFSAISGTTKYMRSDFTVRMLRGKISISGPTDATISLTYYQKAPNMITGTGDPKVYFPQPMLIAERAYVRLKTAMFPDESSEKEAKASKDSVRELFTRTYTTPKFTSKALG